MEGADESTELWRHPTICKVFFKRSNSSIFFVCFWSFQTNNTNSTQNQCEKCPSSIRCRDSNPQPLKHESLPITTRLYAKFKFNFWKEGGNDYSSFLRSHFYFLLHNNNNDNSDTHFVATSDLQFGSKQKSEQARISSTLPPVKIGHDDDDGGDR